MIGVPIPMQDLIIRLAQDAVSVQLLWDADHQQEIERFAEWFSKIDPSFRPILRGLATPRLVMREFELTSRVRIEVDRRLGFEIKMMPLNMGYDIRYGSTSTSESRIRIEVGQVAVSGHQRNEDLESVP